MITHLWQIRVRLSVARLRRAVGDARPYAGFFRAVPLERVDK